MSGDYQKPTNPTPVMKYEGPVIAGLHLAAIIFCLLKTVRGDPLQRPIKVILYLSSLELLLDCAYWADYYIQSPVWLFGVFEFFPPIITTNLMERLAYSWATAYDRYLGSSQGEETTNRLPRQLLFRASLLINAGLLVLFSCGYALSVHNLRMWCNIYIAASWWLFVPYIMVSANKVTEAIEACLSAHSAQRIKRMCRYILILLTLKSLSLVYFTAADANEIIQLEAFGPGWLLFIIYPIVVLIGIGFLLLISTAILVSRRTKVTKSFPDNDADSMSYDMSSSLKDSNYP
jgi:hypothetical protein